MGSLRKACKTFGCPNLHHNPSGYCDECESKYKAKHQQDRPTAQERGYNYRWRKFACDYLKKHPMCAACGAIATVCDHKDMPADVMLKVYGGQFDLNESHYQALCYSCNNRKGKAEDKQMRNDFYNDLKPVGGQEKNEA